MSDDISHLFYIIFIELKLHRLILLLFFIQRKSIMLLFFCMKQHHLRLIVVHSSQYECRFLTPFFQHKPHHFLLFTYSSCRHVISTCQLLNKFRDAIVKKKNNNNNKCLLFSQHGGPQALPHMRAYSS